MDNIYCDIEKILRKLQKPSRYIGSEFNAPVFSPISKKFHFCMIYPDVYEIGQSNQAVRILCNYMNETGNIEAQRSFLPDTESIEIFKRYNIPMFSLETFSPINQFDAIGITISHELLATNLVETLDFANIPKLSMDRTEKDPFVFGGGPMSCNPEPFCDFFDIITIGEGEIATIKCVEKLSELLSHNLSRVDILIELSKLESIYIPSLYDYSSGVLLPKYENVPSEIHKAVYEDFSKSSAYKNCIVPYCDIVRDSLCVEPVRGCARGCRFCQAGFMYRPVRERDIENIVNSIDIGLSKTGYQDISLSSLSVTDHSQISSILDALNAKLDKTGIRVSLSSQRLDSFGVEMAKKMSGKNKSSLTFAPEAATQRLRDVINKNITEADLMDSIKYAFELGWNRCKLYFMIGLPTETDQDVIEIANLCERVYEVAKKSVSKNRKRMITIKVSCSIFIPKAQTPFMWDSQISIEESFKKIKLIKAHLKSRAIILKWHDPFSCIVEGALSRADRNFSKIILKAWELGSKFDAWKESFVYENWVDAAKFYDIDLEDFATQKYKVGSDMPWEHISFGLNKKFFIEEKNKSSKHITTDDCTLGKCQNCGVCPGLNSSNIVLDTRNYGK